MRDRGTEGLVILVVEDDREAHAAIRALLELEGHAVVSAYDGDEAISVLTSGAMPHVIVLDVMLPKKDGFEVCLALRADPRWRGIPIVVYSAVAEPELRRLRRIGAAAVLRKAHDEELLPRTLQAIARRHHAG